MELVKLTHANKNTEMYVVKSLISGFYYSNAQQLTMVVANGGAIFPAKETVDQIKSLLTKEKEQETNGTN